MHLGFQEAHLIKPYLSDADNKDEVHSVVKGSVQKASKVTRTRHYKHSHSVSLQRVLIYKSKGRK